MRIDAVTDDIQALLAAINPPLYQPHKRSGHLSQKGLLFSNRMQFSLPVSFRHNSTLTEMAMRASHAKVLKMKPPGDFGSLSEAFSFRG